MKVLNTTNEKIYDFFVNKKTVKIFRAGKNRYEVKTGDKHYLTLKTKKQCYELYTLMIAHQKRELEI